METTPMDPVQNILAMVDERIDARFRFQEIVMKDQIAATVNEAVTEAVDRAMANAMITLNENIASTIAEAMEKQKNDDNDLQCSVGVCDFVWAFRRFWLPVCPKSWTKFD